MPSCFKEKKATQVAARLLEQGGGTMSYLKLLKLMYLIDREALLSWGRPVTYDHYYSLNQGPILSTVYDLIKKMASGARSFWLKHISRLGEYKLRIAKDPGREELSPAEEALIQKVFKRHGHKKGYELVQVTHKLPEWRNPKGSSIAIEIEDILKAGGKTPSEIGSVLANLRYEREFRRLFQAR